MLTRDERKSKDDEEAEDEANNDVATSAEAPPRLGDGGDGNGGKNGKDRGRAFSAARLVLR